MMLYIKTDYCAVQEKTHSNMQVEFESIIININ